MKVRNVVTKEETHVCNNDPAILKMIKLGLLQIVDATPDYRTGDVIDTGRGIFPAMAPPKTAQTTWGVGFTNRFKERVHAITATCSSCGQHMFHDGLPEKCPVFVHCGTSERAPQHVVVEYAKGWKKWRTPNTGPGTFAEFFNILRQKNEEPEHPLIQRED